MIRLTHDKRTIEKHPRPIFMSESEKAYLERTGEDAAGRFFVSMEIERSDLFAAIQEVERLADWVQEREATARSWRDRQCRPRSCRSQSATWCR